MRDYTESAERFRRDTADHVMTVLHDDGLYRHIRFAAPGSSFYWFDLVTWPGYLAFTGDMDGYVFTRIRDMFEFFRAKSGWNLNTINPQYWAEKLVDGRERTKRYSEERYRLHVTERFVEAVRNGSAPRGLGVAVREHLLDEWVAGYEHEAHAALSAFEFKGFIFDDAWEWDFRDYDWAYLWCCHAIQWGIDQYDAWRVAVPSAVSS